MFKVCTEKRKTLEHFLSKCGELKVNDFDIKKNIEGKFRKKVGNGKGYEC